MKTINFLLFYLFIFESPVVHAEGDCIKLDKGGEKCLILTQNSPCQGGTTNNCSGGSDAIGTTGTSGGGSNEIPKTELQNHKTSTSPTSNYSITTNRKIEITPTMKVVIDQKILSPKVKD